MSFAQKIAGLGIKANFEKLEAGPIVTAYYFSLEHSVPLSKIINRAEDFALAAGVEKVDIQRIGGHVVIFVPNKERKLIDFKESLFWLCTNTEPKKMKLPINLGVDYLGNHAAIDLTEMPHILMAGETGSGKSVLESCIISSLAVCKDPSEMKLILVDTKRLDLPLFGKLPHIRDMVTNLDEFQRSFKSLWIEGQRRLNVLSGASCRNITDYHALGYQLPYIVVVIDEMADLIDHDREKRRADDDYKDNNASVQEWIKRFAAITRAAGIYFICCTQRSSVKIVSGDIKVNLPCRIALRLPTEFDSRTILGTDGAENLLGKGDMLVQFPSTDVAKRFHGPFVKLNDIAEVIDNHNHLREMFEKMGV